MGHFLKSRKGAGGAARFFVAFAALTVLPATIVAAQSWDFQGTSGTKIHFAQSGFAGNPKFTLMEIGNKTGIPDAGVTGIIPLGNFKAVALNPAGHPTQIGVGQFSRPLNLSVELSREIVDKLKSKGVVNPFLYFWDPTQKKWVNVESTKDFGDYSIGHFNRISHPGRGTIELKVQIKSWPADDPACGAGG